MPERLLLTARFLCVLALPFFVLAAPVQAQDMDVDPLAQFADMAARSIGPAGMSGRIAAIDVVERDQDRIYLGSASGGLWLSTNGGISFEPIFDDQPAMSIGAIAIYQKAPDIIYVGTGEGNPRNSQTNGYGMFKTLDGGKTWIHLGLEDTKNIHRVYVHPDNPDVVYAGAQGPAWGETDQRGVFKSTDGGATWDKVLYFNENTGVADLVMDPHNPNHLIAAMWHFKRWPWFFKSGGEGSGLYETWDGGATWNEITEDNGLPAGELGRIGLAFAASDQGRVYAIVEAEENGFYRSDDNGRSWRKVNQRGNYGNRPFYYFDIFVDPQDANRIYSLHSGITFSEDGGISWSNLPEDSIHPDHHAFWISPTDSDFIIEGNDGGANISHDGGQTWRFIENLPLAQFYHINVDHLTPYNVYGGMQDNGSWRGPAYVWRSGGIRNAYWEEVAFGDGFDVVPDSSNQDRYGYAMSQGGNLRRYDLVTGGSTFIQPQHPDGVFLRYNWNAGIAHSPFDNQTIYYGSQFLHKSTDRGHSWEIISPDLTTNDPEKQKQIDSGGLTFDVTGAENYTSILSVAPSFHDPNTIWVGTDDGNVQITRDGGQTWTNVAKNMKTRSGLWVPHIKASRHNPGEAFVIMNDYRRHNYMPYAMHTTDYGRTWTNLVDESDLGDDNYTLSIEQDPEVENLLFLGTEHGLYVSFDKGANWHHWTHGFPNVSTMDVVVQPEEADLVIGTFGRAAFVIDDIRPLRALAREGWALLDQPLVVFDPPTAYMAQWRQAAGTRFDASAIYGGENRDRGAQIALWVGETDASEEGEDERPRMERAGAGMPAMAMGRGQGSNGGQRATVHILDQQGDTLRTLSPRVEPGFNRISWGMDSKGFRFPGRSFFGGGGGAQQEPGGGPLMPGTYTVVVKMGEHEDRTSIDVRLDPRVADEISRADLMAHMDLYEEMRGIIEAATKASDRIDAAQKVTESVSALMAGERGDAIRALRDQHKAVTDSLTAMEEMFSGEDAKGIRRDPMTVQSQLFGGFSFVGGETAPSPSARIRLDQAHRAVSAWLDAVNGFFSTEWPAYRSAVDAAGLELFEDYAPIRIGN